MRLIDGDRLIVSDKDCSGKCRDCNNHVTNCMELADLVNDAPTIDAVEVVRCKDCENWQRDWESSYLPNHHYCAMVDTTTEHDFYCSYGRAR